MNIAIITKFIFKKNPFNRKRNELKNNQKFLFSNGKRHTQPKYHIPMWKTVTGSLKTNKKQQHKCYIRGGN